MPRRSNRNNTAAPAAVALAGPVTLQEMIEANQDSLEALKASRNRLRQLRVVAINPDERERINAELQDVINEINLLDMMQAHLTAAGTTVQPMNPTDVEALREAAAKIDKAIMEDAIVNATLGFIQDLLDATEEIRKLSRRNT
jgi:signal transduction histidine kinase